MSNFYGAVNEIGVTVSSAASSYNVQSAFSSYWNVAVPKRLTINAGVVLGPLTVPASMAGTLIIDHSGAVQGLGGNSSGAAGQTATLIQSTGVTINMTSGSSISGGGGAGGNGGTGGQGRYQSGSGCANSNNIPGGCTTTCNGCCHQGDDDQYVCYTITSGGSGGAFGRGRGYNQAQANGAGGSGGGNSAGAGGSGGNGGQFASGGASGSSGSNGNYSNGSAGSGGGAAGRAITFSGVSAYTIIGTASGTIQGAYT